MARNIPRNRPLGHGQEASFGATVDDPGTQDTTNRAASFPFDPALGVRLLGEIQAEGLRAAGALVDRLVHLVDGPHAAPDSEGDPTADATAPTGPAGVDMGAVLPWFDLWRDLVERTSDTVQRFRATDTGTGEVRVDLDGSLAPTRALAIEVGPDGDGAGEMWLHNGTTTDRGELVPQCGPLSGIDGTALTCDVGIDPPKIDGLPSRSSRGFAITVAVDPSTAPGTYRGIVQVQGADQVWMPLEVVVPTVSS